MKTKKRNLFVYAFALLVIGVALASMVATIVSEAARMAVLP
jgi:hypothetical protein